MLLWLRVLTCTVLHYFFSFLSLPRVPRNLEIIRSNIALSISLSLEDNASHLKVFKKLLVKPVISFLLDQRNYFIAFHAFNFVRCLK